MEGRLAITMEKLLEKKVKIVSLHNQIQRVIDNVPVMERGGAIDYLEKQLANKLQSVLLHPDNELACENHMMDCDWRNMQNVRYCYTCGRARTE